MHSAVNRTGAVLLATVMAALLAAEPEVRLDLKDGTKLHGKLVSFQDGRFSVLREGQTVTADAADVQEVRFVAPRKTPETAPRPPQPTVSEEQLQLERLAKQFVACRPEDMPALAKKLVETHDRELLRKLMDQFGQAFRDHDAPHFRRLHDVAAHMSIKVYVEPVERLEDLRRDLPRRFAKDPQDERRGQFVKALLAAIDERIATEKRTADAPKKTKPGAP